MSFTVSTNQISKIFRSLKKCRVMVIGDCMLDDYWYGKTERISPEAPVPILQLTKKERRPGGAANVALNCASLGAQVSLFTILGKDQAGEDLKSWLHKAGIQHEGCLLSNDRITGTKTRLISRQQHVLRIDDEITAPLNAHDEHRFIDTCLRAIQIDKPDVLILEDYNKGIFSENSIQHIISHAKRVGVLVAVDPKKDNFFSYRDVDIFKPNLKELCDALQTSFDPSKSSHLKQAHYLLEEKLHHRISLLTLSEHGMFVQQDKTYLQVPAHVRVIADVSGAGDTVISVFSLFYVMSKDLILSLHAANLAGGLVCEIPGVVPINPANLKKELLALSTE